MTVDQLLQVIGELYARNRLLMQEVSRLQGKLSKLEETPNQKTSNQEN